MKEIKTIKISIKTYDKLNQFKHLQLGTYKVNTYDQIIQYLIDKVNNIHWKEKILEKQIETLIEHINKEK